MRIFSVLAGLAGSLAALALGISGHAEMSALASTAGGSEQGAQIAIAWAAMTYAMGLTGVCVLVSAWADINVARIVPIFATALFGGFTVIMLVAAGSRMADLAEGLPVFIMAGITALNALAASRA